MNLSTYTKQAPPGLQEATTILPHSIWQPICGSRAARQRAVAPGRLNLSRHFQTWFDVQTWFETEFTVGTLAHLHTIEILLDICSVCVASLFKIGTRSLDSLQTERKIGSGILNQVRRHPAGPSRWRAGGTRVQAKSEAHGGKPKYTLKVCVFMLARPDPGTRQPVALISTCIAVVLAKRRPKRVLARFFGLLRGVQIYETNEVRI